MKILLYSHYFYPSVGGLEKVSETLANYFVAFGHECVVITQTLELGSKTFTFSVKRGPSKQEKNSLLEWSDIVFSNGASMELLWTSLRKRKPFVWTHAGYQASCIDGLGWVDGHPAPLTPFASFLYHAQNSGIVKAIKGATKLLFRRICCQYLVNYNIAISDWVAYRQPFKRQIRIYNPVELNQEVILPDEMYYEYDFLYLGRLVSEKGVVTLIDALSILHKNGYYSKLLLIGEGNWRSKLEQHARQLGLGDYITFAGKKIGHDLKDYIKKAPVAVVPSEWEEPMGVVALELLSYGKTLIVSKNGGLAECIEDAGLTFNNGNARELADKMQLLLTDSSLMEKLKNSSKKQLVKFSPEQFVKEYLDLFARIINRQ